MTSETVRSGAVANQPNGLETFCPIRAERLLRELFPAEPALGAVLSELATVMAFEAYRIGILEELRADHIAGSMDLTHFSLDAFLIWSARRARVWNHLAS